MTADGWRAVASELAAGRATLLGLWGDAEPAPSCTWRCSTTRRGDIAVVSLACPDGKFPSVGALHPPAIRLERAIHSLYGFEPVGAPDTRPWLDLGFWDVQHPLGARTRRRPSAAAYAFLPAEGEALHQIPVGPVHAGIIEPGHFRFTASGETVVRLEAAARLRAQGHRVADGGRDPRAGGAACRAHLRRQHRRLRHRLRARGRGGARTSRSPPRARYLRALMAELERLANHFGDIGAICNDASFSHHARALRHLARARAARGRRLLRPPADDGSGRARRRRRRSRARRRERSPRRLAARSAQRFPRLIELYDNTASLQDRTVGTGIVSAELARQFGAGGYVGRASGRDFDARKTPGYAPYDRARLRRSGARPKATSMRASGSASAKSSKAWR